MDGGNPLLFRKADQAVHEKMPNSLSLSVRTHCHIGNVPFIQNHKKPAVSQDFPFLFHHQEHGVLTCEIGKKSLLGPGR